MKATKFLVKGKKSGWSRLSKVTEEPQFREGMELIAVKLLHLTTMKGLRVKFGKKREKEGNKVQHNSDIFFSVMTDRSEHKKLKQRCDEELSKLQDFQDRKTHITASPLIFWPTLTYLINIGQ